MTLIKVLKKPASLAIGGIIGIFAFYQIINLNHNNSLMPVKKNQEFYYNQHIDKLVSRTYTQRKNGTYSGMLAMYDLNKDGFAETAAFFPIGLSTKEGDYFYNNASAIRVDLNKDNKPDYELRDEDLDGKLETIEWKKEDKKNMENKNIEYKTI